MPMNVIGSVALISAAHSRSTGKRRGKTDARRNERRYRSSLVRDRGAGRAVEVEHFEALEADFTAPFLEIGGGIIERIAEFDQHV